jgi:hypothetical protein
MRDLTGMTPPADRNKARPRPASRHLRSDILDGAAAFLRQWTGERARRSRRRRQLTYPMLVGMSSHT